MKGGKLGPGVSCLLALCCSAALLLGSVCLTAAGAPREKPAAASLPLRLEVDQDRQARAFYGGLQAIVSIAGTFEMNATPTLTGSRTGIFRGPWQAGLQRVAPGGYALSGRDAKSGAAYTLRLSQLDASSLEVDYSFTAPSRPADLAFDILKLSGDLFAGAGLESSPAALTDTSQVAAQPASVARRILLTGKNRVLVRGAACDIEITDLLGSGSILVGDFRAVPWDKEKSIIFIGDRPALVPGRHYRFRYAVRSLAPSRSALIRDERATGHPVAAGGNRDSFGAPPREEQQAAGYYRLPDDTVISGNPRGAAEAILLRELRSRTGLRCRTGGAAAPGSSGGIRLELAAASAADPLPAEGYQLRVEPAGVVIRGADARGCLYGAYALLNRLQQVPGGWRVACGTTRDWPELPQRGGCIEMLPPARRDVALFKRYLDAISRSGGNLVIFLHDAAQVEKWRTASAGPGWTEQQLGEISQYARFLGLEVWAGMGSVFSSGAFPGLPLAEGSNYPDPSGAGAYRRLFALYDRLLRVYRPGTLLISHDEMKGLSRYAFKLKSSEADIFARDVGTIRDWLSARGVTTAIWGDMLLDHERWEKEVGSANSNNPMLDSGATHETLGLLPRDLVILDWHYDLHREYRSVELFRRQGFRVLGATWHDPQAARALAASVKKFGGQGIVATDWGLLATLSPAATTLCAPLCGWSSRCSPAGDSDVAFLAGYLREPDFTPSAYRQVPLPLGKAANRSTWDQAQGSGTGLFDLGPLLDLRAFPSGSHAFAGVQFAIASPARGTRENCIVSPGNPAPGAAAPEVLLPAGGAALRGVAFLHSCLVPEPQLFPRELGAYLIEYQSGREVRVALQENWNITDVRSSPSLRSHPWTFSRSPDELAGCYPAWRGFSAGGVPLNAQTFIWRNPFPKEKVCRITLQRSQVVPHSSIVLLGVTLLQ